MSCGPRAAGPPRAGGSSTSITDPMAGALGGPPPSFSWDGPDLGDVDGRSSGSPAHGQLLPWAAWPCLVQGQRCWLTELGGRRAWRQQPGSQGASRRARMSGLPPLLLS